MRDVHCRYIFVYTSWELQETLRDIAVHSAVRRLSNVVNRPSAGVSSTLVGSVSTLSFAQTFIFESLSSHVNASSAIPIIATPVRGKQRIIVRTFADIIIRGGVNVFVHITLSLHCKHPCDDKHVGLFKHADNSES